MAKYHFSQAGTVAPCEATIRPCPLGGIHYDSKEEAQWEMMDLNMIRNHWRTGGLPGDFGWRCTCGWTPDDGTFSGLAKVNAHADEAHATEVAAAKAVFDKTASKAPSLQTPTDASASNFTRATKIKSRRVLKTVAACRAERIMYKGNGENIHEPSFRLTRIFGDGIIGLGDIIASLDNGQVTVIPVSKGFVSDDQLLELVNEDYDQTYVPLPEEYRKVY